LVGLTVIDCSTAGATDSVRVCAASGVTPLCAVIAIGKLPLTAAVPLTLAVPSWLSVNVTPFGRLPTSIRLGTGKPVVITVNEPTKPTVNVAPFPLVIAGG